MTAANGTKRGLRGLRGPHHAGHTIALDHLGALSLPVGDDGVVIGDDGDGFYRRWWASTARPRTTSC